MRQRYKVLISQIKDPTSFVAEILPTGLSYAHEQNGPGSALVSMPLNSLSSEVMSPGSHCMWIDRDNQLVWGGIIWTASGSIADNTLDIAATGFHSYSRRRVIGSSLTYDQVDQLDIARGLIDEMESDTESLGIIQTSDTRISGVDRDRTYNDFDFKFFGTAIEQLAEVNDGFDFRYDVSYAVSGDPQVEFVAEYPSTGRPTNLVFEIGGNVESVEFSFDGTSLTNKPHAVGSGTGDDVLSATEVDTTRQLTYPVYESVSSFPDVSRLTTLQEHTERMMGRGTIVSQLVMRVRTDSHTPIGSYRIGDIVKTRGQFGYLDIHDQDYRITGTSVTLGSNGEIATVHAASASAFEEWS